MRISPAEQNAIKAALAAAERYGYGNLVSHLQTAWAQKLVDEGMDEDSARRHSGASERGYPFLMHKDLVERGEWDETGARYATNVANV